MNDFIRYGRMGRSDLAGDRRQWWALVSKALNLQIPQDGGKWLRSGAAGGLSSRMQLHTVGHTFLPRHHADVTVHLVGPGLRTGRPD
jgi:hypothetical protein